MIVTGYRNSLHSNLVLFKYEQPFGYNDGVFGLYIPIWFYSNLSVAGTLSVTEDALHSNLVLFKFVRDTKKKKSQAFTFQSGSIQILYVQYDRDYRDTFTFQSGSIQIIRFISWWSRWKTFTFQSGSIQIFTAQSFTASYITFTFQSGSIQMCLFGLTFLCQKFFTFQSGSIQMVLNKYRENFCKPLHSNLVLFKCWGKFFLNLSVTSLHSNLVLFKCF